MPSNLSHTENARLLSKRVSAGDIEQYFDLSDDAVKELSEARASDNFEEMATILSSNLASGGQGFEPAINSAYDSEIEDLSDRIINGFFTNIELRSRTAFQEQDVDEIREVINELDFDVPRGFITRKKNILLQLQKAERLLAIPENLEQEAIRLLKQRNKDPKLVKTTKVIQRWGRARRRALVTWGSRGILAVEFLERPAPKPKKVKLKYIPTKEEFKGRTREQILSRKGKGFTIRERLFFDARSNKSPEKVYEDYSREFGKVRPKQNVLSQIKKQR